MKILWIIPLASGERLQFTSRNECARSLKTLKHVVNATVSLSAKTNQLDGFSNVRQITTQPISIVKKLRFHLRMLKSAWDTDADVVMFGPNFAHLLPLAYTCTLWKNRPVFVMDIRTVPVDIGRGWRDKLHIWRYNASIKLADIFCDGMTVITPMLGEKVRQHLNRIDRKLGIWSSGVRFEHFRPEGPSMRKALSLERKKVLFYHGVLSPNRGIQNAIRAVASLSNEIPDLFFLLVGDGEARPEFEDLAKKLNISDRLIITGKVSYALVPNYVRVADMGILPFPSISWWEVSSPIKLMEYLAMKVPVIATDIPANRTVLNKTGGGCLIPNNHPDTISAAIRQYMNNGKRIFKEYPLLQVNLEEIISWDAQAKKLEGFLKSLIKSKKKIENK